MGATNKGKVAERLPRSEYADWEMLIVVETSMIDQTDHLSLLCKTALPVV